ncbi:allantoinase [Sporothrix brasiliensis 5110]|uniref:Allantoinase n=1 Tax=Sporothrix brasiliensis 5110 TaxID=1398154 RepID=A0A0C2J6B1_9PEZI|nr:allantoinase [Sporothrix brasiliensis 5110]KIH94515.1 allantoinase [Sporothrix brasiliensis 5110]
MVPSVEIVAPSQDSQLVVLASTRAVLTQPDNSLILSPATITISPVTGTIVSIARAVLPASAFPANTQYVDYSPSVLMPGIVDAHVHLNEPGRTEWEGFYTGTRAAASGGVTTVVDMPLNAIPPTTTVQGFKEKLAASQGQLWVDVGFYGGVVPGNADELLPLVDAGVRGFKGFLIHSGVDEFPAVSAKDISLAMETLKDADTTLMFHAEMLPPIADSVGDAVQTSEPPLAPHGALEAYNTFLESRPPVFETCAIEEIVYLAPIAPNLHLHIVHLSATECIPILRAARERGINITAETCFHYLGLTSDAIEDGDTRHKCCPPIRSQINQDGLWTELGRPDSIIKTVVSDHSPCTPDLKLLPGHLAAPAPGTAASLQVENVAPDMLHSDSGVDLTAPEGETTKAAKAATPVDEAVSVLASPAEEERAKMAAAVEKQGDFFAAWGGISSVGLGLPIMYTAAQARRAAAHAGAGNEHHQCADADCDKVVPASSTSAVASTSVPDIIDIVRLCSQATAEQVGLSHRKGGLRVGLDADVCVFDDAMRWTFTQGDMRWKNRCSPWEGHTFEGRVRATWLRGQAIFALGGTNDGFVGGRPVGAPLIEKRGTAKEVEA